MGHGNCSTQGRALGLGPAALRAAPKSHENVLLTDPGLKSATDITFCMHALKDLFGLSYTDM